MAETLLKGSNYTIAPAGVHQAVCCDVIPAFKVERTNKKTGEKYTRDELTIVFQIGAINEDNNKRHLVRATFGLNLAPQGGLKPFLEAWRAKNFTKEELKEGFVAEKLIGVNALINVVHNGDWANIASVMPLTAGQEKMVIENYTRKTNDVPTHSGQPEMEASSEIPTDDAPF